ncbi:MAG: glutathione S-transferase family protein [Aestuariivirga sp.]
MLTLFYATNTCSLASHIALEDSGASYEAKRLNFADGDQRKPDYLHINPKGRVPALVTDQGILTETPAILTYVGQSFPKANLIPANDPFRLGQIQSFISYLCSTVHPAHAHRVRGYRWSDDAAAQESMKKKVPQNIGECFDLIENSYFKGPWVMGADYTVADPYLFTIAKWLEADGVDPRRFPKVNDHRNRMAERPAVKKVLARENA